MRLSRYEMETIINYNQEEDTAHIYTYDPVLIRRMDKIVQTLKLSQNPSIVIESNERNGGRGYTIPKKWVSVKMPRLYSEEKRQELSLRAKKNFGHLGK